MYMYLDLFESEGEGKIKKNLKNKTKRGSVLGVYKLSRQLKISNLPQI